MEEIKERKPYREGDFVVAYIGTIGQYRGILQMIRAIEIANKKYSVRLALAGAFSERRIETEAHSEPGWKYVDYCGWLSNDEVKALLERSHLGMILFQPSPHNLESSPNKLFEYMQFGLPVIMSDYTFWRQDLDRINCGIFVDPTDPGKVAEAIVWIIEHREEAAAMGKRGQEAVKLEFNWEREMDKLLCLYHSILGGSKRSGQNAPHAQS
jgi:glycosyltransferase involved in cell wall biosynthesis